MVHIRGLTLTALLVAAPAAALYMKSGSVQILDSKSFEKEILQSDNAAVSIMVYYWAQLTVVTDVVDVSVDRRV